MRGQGKERRDEIEGQAVRRLIALLDDPSPERRGELAEWIARDPAHGVAFAGAEAAWDEAARLKARSGSTAGAGEPPVDGRSDVPRDRRPSRRRFVAAGAIAAAAIGVPGLLLLGRRSDYRTAVGELRDVRLADGSLLHLNTRSHVEVEYGADRRLLRLLQGEAFFDVAYDRARPFDVEARGIVVRALGTAFNVRLRNSVVELTVTKGVVGVRPPAGPMQKVSAHRGAVIQPRTVALAQLDQRLLAQRTAWRERMIELDGESVTQAVDEFNRYRQFPIVIGDERLAPLRIGGRFRTDESDQFITALQEMLPVRVVPDRDGSVLLLYRDDQG